MARSAQPDDALLAPLTQALAQAAPRRLVVAWSGGPDSSALLHACLQCVGDLPVLAVHVDHGLQAASAEMARWCEARAELLDVQCVILKLAEAPDAGDSVEAWAREQRYTALASQLQAGDVLLTAHHRDDQAESVLLALLRGGGLPGMAGLAASRAMGVGHLLRPWKDVSRSEIRRYVQRHAIASFDDPSNADTRFTRNWLRRDVLPTLSGRVPGATQALARSASHAAEAQGLLDDLAALDLADLDADAHSLSAAHLQTLSMPRQRNVLRHWLAEQGWPTPSANVLEQLLDNVAGAADDAQPLLTFGGVEVRRYRARLYVSEPLTAPPASWCEHWHGERFKLPAGLGALSAQSSGDWSVRLPHQGDVVRQAGRPRKAWARWCQEQGVPVWLRNRVPLTFAGDTLCGVGSRVIQAETAPEGLRWHSSLPGAACLAA